VKQGDVLKKERDRKKITIEGAAEKLGVSPEQYRDIEGGNSPAEELGTLLAKIAIKLETPTSRLLAESGKAADTKPGQAGELITRHRERRGKTPEQMAELLEIPLEEYQKIEAGQSGIEEWGPFFLRFAEMIDQPVFNLFYPAGLHYSVLKPEDYP
jgi:transcriptional regulator with XRE-family HTH domain